ncbi:MAG: cytochrome c biogenesis protein DipZ [Corynebacteriales bacterium]|nr:cytochrome c biogenesis protein DipZ [Mycobacteriales bacterium]
MFTLILIGLLGGLITGISPCILPVLPVIFFAGADTTSGNEEKRNLRPYAVIGGLVLSFSLFTLLGSLLISALNLPNNIMKIVGLVVLGTVGLGLIFPRIEERLERLFSWIPQKQRTGDRGAFVLGLGLGLLYVPCAGPVLAAITIAGATGNIGADTVALTLSFAIGATAPLLIFALAGRRVAERVRAFRTRARTVRTAGGVVMIVLAVALVYDLPATIQRALPNYTDSLQRKVEDNKAFRPQLAKLSDGENSKLANCPSGAKTLQDDCGPAQPIEANSWLNTPNNDAIDIKSLKGNVVIVDFWTYSCINCQRSVPHVQEWYETYRNYGLSVIGVHTPEFAFERDTSNVQDGAKKLGITYPIAIDNDYATWTNYRNRYWPALFLMDAEGQVRYIHLGEGKYEHSEKMIRTLLADAKPDQKLPPPTDLAEATLTENRTPETYLSYTKLGKNFASGTVTPDEETSYKFPKTQDENTVALDGAWTVHADRSTAGANAQIALRYRAAKVYVVAGGEGSISYRDGSLNKTQNISGPPRVYTLLDTANVRESLITIKASPGIEMYAFTFG